MKARLYRMVFGPTDAVRKHRAKVAEQRAWLEANDEPSRLDRADWDHRIRKDKDGE
jgi:hypothetical protein